MHTCLKQNVNFVPCLSGAMTQPFVAKASAVLCDPANPASNGSGNYVAAHITNTLEFADAPIFKFNQVVKTQDHVMSELSKQSSDTLEIFSKYLTNLAASSTHLDTVQSKTPTNAWEMSQDVGVRNSWPGLDLHDFIQDLVNVWAPLQTLIRVQEKRIATLEVVQRTARMPGFCSSRPRRGNFSCILECENRETNFLDAIRACTFKVA